MDEMHQLLQVARGLEKADLVVANGDLVDVYSGEVLKDCSVAIKGTRIAYVGQNVGHTIGPETQFINAQGKTLIPGLVEGHAHMIYCSPLDEFLRYVMKGGTTTIVTESQEIAYAQGYPGLLEFLEALRDQPIKLFATIPPLLVLSPELRRKAVDVDLLGELLRREEVVGLGESYWQLALQDAARFLRLSQKALEEGKTVEGHAAGARGKNLLAYLASGVSSCHESVSLVEALEKLRLGLRVMIREGSIRKELAALAGLKDEQIDTRRLMLVTDGISPGDLLEKGYLEHVVQKAIDLGFDPVTAIQMATLNPAEHFHLDSFLGGIAPGKYADLVVIPDPRTIRAEYVISNGKLIARGGELLVEPRKVRFTKSKFKEFRRVSPDELKVRADGDEVRVRVINQETPLVTRELVVTLPVSEGEIRADPSRDILKVAVLSSGGKLFVGFVKGFGMRWGALATSSAWDMCGIVAVGVGEEDLAGAINQVIEHGGGVVVYAGGLVREELPLPGGGLTAELPLESIAERLERIKGILRELGCSLLDPTLTLAVITTPAIPFLRATEEGLVDLRTGQFLDLLVH